MITDATWNIISMTQIFAGLSKSDFEIISEHSTVISCKKDELIVEENKDTMALFIILSGQFEVFLPKQSNTSLPTKLNILSKADFFGEYSLIDTEPASASVRAMEPSELFKLTKDDFEKLVGSNDRIGKTIYHNLLKKLIKNVRDKDKEFDMFFT